MEMRQIGPTTQKHLYTYTKHTHIIYSIKFCVYKISEELWTNCFEKHPQTIFMGSTKQLLIIIY